MAETFRIEIPINAIDKTGPGFDAATKRVSKWETQMARSEKQLQRMNKTRWQVTLNTIDRVGPVLQKVNTALARATSRTWRIGMSIVGLPGRMLNSLFSLPTLLTGLAGAGAVKGGIMWPLELAGNLEQSRIAFETMLGSSAKASAFMGEMQRFAENTPFDLVGLQDNAKRLLAFGFSAEQVLPMLTAVGNAAAGTGKGAEAIDRITLALSQMRAKGKVSFEEMNQLNEAGVSGWIMLAEAMGTTEGAVMDMATRGLLPANEAIQMLIDGMNRKFPNLMERQSRSWLGLWNTIKEITQSRLFTAWGEGLRTAVQPRLEALVDWMNRNKDVVEQWAVKLEAAGRTMATWVLDKIDQLKAKLGELLESDKWQRADFFGKLQIIWDDVIVQPFFKWWNDSGRDQVNAIATEIGGAMAAGIGKAINEALPAILREAGKIAPGGDKASPLSWLSAIGVGWAGTKAIGWLAWLRTLMGGAGAAAAGGGAAAGTAATAAETAAELVQIFGPNGQVLSTVATGSGATGTGAAAGSASALGLLGGAIAWLAGVVAAVQVAKRAAPYIPGTGAYTDRLVAEQYDLYVNRGELRNIPSAIGPMPTVPWYEQWWASPWNYFKSRAGIPVSTVQPNVSVEYKQEVSIDASATNADDVLEVLRKNGEAVADDVAGALAVRLGMVWANM